MLIRQVNLDHDPSVSAVIVNWNGDRFLPGLIRSLLRQTHSLKEIVLIDNGSTDRSLASLRNDYPMIRVIENRQNLGFSVGCNQGIRLTSGGWILILNSDVILMENYVEACLEQKVHDRMVGAIGGKIFRFDSQIIDTTGQYLSLGRKVVDRGHNERDRGRYESEGFVESVCGAVGLYKREMLEDVSIAGEYFDEDFFAFYEDMDLMWRAQKLGWKAYYAPKAVAYHFRGGTNSPRKKGNALLGRFEFARRPRSIQKHILMNRYLMIIKNDRPFALLKNLPFILIREAVIWGYVLLRQPGLVADLVRQRHCFLQAYRKRKMIQGSMVETRWDCSTS